MDYNLYITLLEEDLKQVGIAEIKTSWGGESVSYTPRRFMFEDKVLMFFTEFEMLPSAGELVGKNQVVLRIVDGLRELEWEVNKQTENLKTNNIIKMLQKICQLDKFSIYIFGDDEIIEQHIKYNKEKDIILLVSAALLWESPQNIEIFENNG